MSFKLTFNKDKKRS